MTKEDDVKVEDIEPTQKDIHDNIGLVDPPPQVLLNLILSCSYACFSFDELGIEI